MAGLKVPDKKYVGRFRGEPGLETTRVWVGGYEGAPPERVASELAAFEQTLQRAVAALDARYPRAEAIDTDGLAAVIDLCAWAHAEWVRIHPFANGNGRTARIWANALLMRYGLPPAIRLRPRPDGGYGDAGAAAMNGDGLYGLSSFASAPVATSRRSSSPGAGYSGCRRSRSLGS